MNFISFQNMAEQPTSTARRVQSARLTITTQLQRVATTPGRMPRAPDGLVVAVTLPQATTLASRGREATHLTVLVHRFSYPLGIRVSTDGLVEWVDEDHFKILVSSVFTDPIRIKNTESTQVTTSTSLQARHTGSGISQPQAPQPVKTSQLPQ